RWPAGPVAGRHDARVDVEPVGRIRGPAVPGAVESPEGARRAQTGASAKGEGKNMRRTYDAGTATKTRTHEKEPIGFVLSGFRGSALVGLAVTVLFTGAVAQKSATRQHIETLASEKLD